jgi:FMN phosphatase YigB (HAD superfamily)
MILSSSNIFVFDLDDTLYSERDFEKSGIEFVYNSLNIKHIELEAILNNRKNWIEQIIDVSNSQITKQMILEIYQNHFPSIQLYKTLRCF